MEFAQISLKPFKNLFSPQVFNGISPGIVAKLASQFFIVDQSTNRGMNGARVFGRNDNPTRLLWRVTSDDVSDLGIWLGSCHYRPAAREHPGKFRRHNQVSGSCPLR